MNVPTRTKPIEKMTEAEAKRLRAKMPDDPVRLPPHHLACKGRGIAVDSNPTTTVTPLRATENSRRTAPQVQFSRCSECQGIHEAANAYVEAHPLLAARLGNEIARERVESVLYGLAILGQPVPADLGLLLPRLHPPAHGVRFINPLTLTRDRCSPHPWAHVTLTQRAELRAGFAAALRDRLALSAPSVTHRCPTGGCMLCGVASVDRAAIEVARRGGVEVATQAVWWPLLVLPTSLGGNGPQRIGGHACPDCARKVDEVGGVGWRARTRALVAYLTRSSPQKGIRLRSMLDSDFPRTLPAWGAAQQPSSAEPWAHLQRVIDRL